MIITGKTYDVLKFIALILLPALGTLYFTLANIWGLPAAEQVLGTITATDTFLGILLGISAKNFGGVVMGTLNVFPNADRSGKVAQAQFEGDPLEAIEGKKRAVLKVNETDG